MQRYVIVIAVIARSQFPSHSLNGGTQSFFYIDSIWFRHFTETRLRSTTEYTDECLPIVPALIQTIKSLF